MLMGKTTMFDDVKKEEIKIINLLKNQSRMGQDQILAELERKFKNEDV